MDTHVSPSPPFPPAPSYRIGTIGCSYPGWRGTFYPASVSQGEQLAAYATAFDTVELDTTFYATPPRERVQKWVQAVPDGFQVCVKTPRQITHDAPLSCGNESMRVFLTAISPLHAASKLGAVLLQFPPQFLQSRHAELGAFLGTLPTEYRYAVELRHRSWLQDSTASLLKAHRCAWVVADYGRKVWPLTVTADFLYVRFVGIHHRFERNDREEIDVTSQLKEWTNGLQVARATLPADAPIYVLFANDYAGHAPATANRFRGLVGLPMRQIARKDPATQGSLF